MRRNNAKFLPICVVVLTSTIFTYFTLYKKNSLLAFEVKPTYSRHWPQTDKKSSLLLTGLQKKIHSVTSSGLSKKAKNMVDNIVPQKPLLQITKFNFDTINEEVAKVDILKK